MKDRKTLYAKRLLDGLALIDEKYITNFAEGFERRRKKNIIKQIRLAVSIAACVCIAVTGTLFGIHYYRESLPKPPIIDGTTPSGSDTAVSDFVIEDGRLIAYNGAETEIVIPDDVTEITANAFNKSAVADSITSIHVSSSVRTIDKKAFSELDSLGNISVDGDSTSYVSRDGVLGSVDGTVYFSAVLTPEEASYKLPQVIIDLHGDTNNYGHTASIMIGKGVIEVMFESYSGCYLTSISSFGYEESFDFPLSEWGVSTSQTDSAYIISLYSAEGEESTWIFTEKGVYEISHADEDESGYHTKFVLRFGDEEVFFDGKQIDWRNSNYYFEDLTGDGTPEIIAVFVWGTGTGVHAEDVHVFDSVTLEEYKVEDLPETLTDHVVFASDDTSYTVAASGGTYQIHKSELDTDEDSLAENISVGIYYHYTVSGGKLRYTDFCRVGAVESCGKIEVVLKYDGGGFIYESSEYISHKEDEGESQTDSASAEVMDIKSYMNYFVSYFHEPYKAGDRIGDEDILTLIFQFYFRNKDNPGLFSVYDDGTLNMSVNGDELRKTAKLLLGDNFDASEYHSFFDGAVEDYSAELDTYTFHTAKDYWGGDLVFIEDGTELKVTESGGTVTVTASIYEAPSVPCDPSENIPLGGWEYTFRKITDNRFTYYRIEEVCAVEDMRENAIGVRNK